MARIKISFPEKTFYKTNSTISVGMINYGGHLGNDSVLTIFQDTRIAFLATNNLSEINIGNEIGLIQNDAAVQYLSEGFLHDEITTKISFEITSKFGFDIIYQIENAANNKIVAIGKTGMIAFNYQTKKISPIPPSFATLIQ